MGSDAHSPEYVGTHILEVYEMLREIGFRYVTAFEDRKAPFYLSGGLTIMREITYESIVSAVRDLCIEANCALPCPGT